MAEKVDKLIKKYARYYGEDEKELKTTYLKLSSNDKGNFNKKLKDEIKKYEEQQTRDKRSDAEKKKESDNWYKELIARVKTTEKTRLQPGFFYFYHYKSYNYPSPLKHYDTQPLIFLIDNYVVGGKRYLLGINFHWLNKPMRLALLKKIYKTYKKQFENNEPIPLSYNDIKGLTSFKFAYVIIRKYIRANIKKKVVRLEHKEMLYSINLDTHKFLGISPEQAWALSISKL